MTGYQGDGKSILEIMIPELYILRKVRENPLITLACHTIKNLGLSEKIAQSIKSIKERSLHE